MSDSKDRDAQVADLVEALRKYYPEPIVAAMGTGTPWEQLERYNAAKDAAVREGFCPVCLGRLSPQRWCQGRCGARWVPEPGGGYLAMEDPAKAFRQR